MNKIFLRIAIVLAGIGLLFLIYEIGFYRGCAKVVGKWETTLMNDSLIESHCYGERNMWRDSVEREVQQK